MVLRLTLFQCLRAFQNPDDKICVILRPTGMRFAGNLAPLAHVERREESVALDLKINFRQVNA